MCRNTPYRYELFRYASCIHLPPLHLLQAKSQLQDLLIGCLSLCSAKKTKTGLLQYSIGQAASLVSVSHSQDIFRAVHPLDQEHIGQNVYRDRSPFYFHECEEGFLIVPASSPTLRHFLAPFARLVAEKNPVLSHRRPHCPRASFPSLC